MPRAAVLKPGHKAIQAYFATLETYRGQNVKHEGALETAFQRLLADTSRPHGWTLIPKQKVRVGKQLIYPDGTLRDMFQTRCGYWEAKDTDDDLDQEITKKIAKGYPRSNIIFEDTRRAVLFQGGIERYRFDLTDPNQIAALLNEFYAYTEPEIDNFHQAVEEFKSRVPELARGLVEILTAAHKDNGRFQKAFESFLTLCQETLNPNISRAAVDEMLVQHLLTERLIRKIFDNPEFARRNVIAAEVEKVIAALVSRSFNRDEFLKSLDRFYRAIEDAAHTLEDFTEKQHFLNTVYERFFQGYSVKVADTHGIVYTPQAIVDFMCASVAEVLQTEFGLTLGSPGVNILDPCTGNFIVNLLRRIPKKDLPRMYKEQLFANEVMLLPYYIAALNIEHAYYELTGQYEPFEGLCPRRADAASLAGGENDIITKWDIFYYVYGVLHHPGYRTKFADNLKRELPRIPYAPDFWAFADAGRELARLHVDYEKVEPYPLKWLETPGVPLSYKVEDKMRLSKDKTSLRVNPSLTLAGIPPETFQYRLGNRSALDWVIDQYQVKEDKRSGIRSDPNRADDTEYIVRLVGQVIHVSLETVRIVAGLPEKYAE